MKTKLSALILIAALLSQTLVSCGSTDGDSETTDSVTTSTSNETTAETTEETTETTAPAADVSVTELADAVKEALGNEYLPDMAIDAEALDATFGVKSEWVEEFYGEMPMISFNPDTFLAIKATEGNVENVEAALNSYRDYLINNSVQYPANVQKVNACQVYTNGDYVFFIMLAVIPDELLDATDEQVVYDYCVESNQKAIDAIDALLG